MDKYIMIYFRKRDGIYVIPEGITTRDTQCHIEPFEYLPLNSKTEDIWGSIEKALQNANRRVPHPKSWGEETAWYRKAGVKTWREFAGKAKVMSLTETQYDWVFKSHYWNRGAVVSDKETAVIVPKNTPREDIIAILKNILNK